MIVSQFLPPNIRRMLLDVAKAREDERQERIDAATIQASVMYPELVRHPSDDSRASEWALMRGFHDAR